MGAGLVRLVKPRTQRSVLIPCLKKSPAPPFPGNSVLTARIIISDKIPLGLVLNWNITYQQQSGDFILNVHPGYSSMLISAGQSTICR